MRLTPIIPPGSQDHSAPTFLVDSSYGPFHLQLQGDGVMTVVPLPHPAVLVINQVHYRCHATLQTQESVTADGERKRDRKTVLGGFDHQAPRDQLYRIRNHPDAISMTRPGAIAQPPTPAAVRELRIAVEQAARSVPTLALYQAQVAWLRRQADRKMRRLRTIVDEVSLLATEAMDLQQDASAMEGELM